MIDSDYPKNVWLEHLIWCPSQIEYYFDDPSTKKTYVVYLRWRYSDPWQACLHEVLEDGEWGPVIKDFVLPRDFVDVEYKELEKACIFKLRELFPHINFPNPTT